MRLFKCRHNYVVTERSNALQFDDMGYPLRLCVVECTKCKKIEHLWLDTSRESAREELDNGKSFIVEWR